MIRGRERVAEGARFIHGDGDVRRGDRRGVAFDEDDLDRDRSGLTGRAGRVRDGGVLLVDGVAHHMADCKGEIEEVRPVLRVDRNRAVRAAAAAICEGLCRAEGRYQREEEENDAVSHGAVVVVVVVVGVVVAVVVVGAVVVVSVVPVEVEVVCVEVGAVAAAGVVVVVDVDVVCVEETAVVVDEGVVDVRFFVTPGAGVLVEARFAVEPVPRAVCRSGSA